MHRFCNSNTEATRGLNLCQSIGVVDIAAKQGKTPNVYDTVNISAATVEYRFDHLPESEGPKAGGRGVELDYMVKV